MGFTFLISHSNYGILITVGPKQRIGKFRQVQLNQIVSPNDTPELQYSTRLLFYRKIQMAKNEQLHKRFCFLFFFKYCKAKVMNCITVYSQVMLVLLCLPPLSDKKMQCGRRGQFQRFSIYLKLSVTLPNISSRSKMTIQINIIYTNNTGQCA